MGVLKVQPSPVNKSAGFTLIEVLIALAILSISLTAIIKSTSQNIKDTIYLQDKTIANWVAMNALNEARLGLTKIPVEPGKLEHEASMLGEQWVSRSYYTSTPNPHIRE
jgi:general secretion pathway protein I